MCVEREKMQGRQERGEGKKAERDGERRKKARERCTETEKRREINVSDQPSQGGF